MKFNVIFRTRSNKEKLIEYIGAAGMDILDALKDAVPFLKEIPTEDIKVDTECPIGSYYTQVSLSEKEARTSKHFGARTKIEVIVPPLFLSRFVEWATRKKYSRHDKKKLFFFNTVSKRLDVVFCAQRLDTKRLIAAWSAEGFPLEWKINKQGENK